jgi:aspartate aminotransferase-like enzyme
MTYYFTPGPINIDTSIKKINNNLLISHRTSEFEKIFKKSKELTLNLFNLPNNNDYDCIFMNGTGTLGIESMIYSYVRFKRTLVISNGYFGEKWVKMLNNYTNNYYHLKFNWNQLFNYEIIENIISNEKFDLILVVHLETSTGMINDIYKLNSICNKYNIGIVCDMVSSIGSYNIDLNNLNKILLLCFSSNKAIGSYPGIVIIIFNKKILNNDNTNISYLNLNLYYNYSLKNQTPFTFSSNLLNCYCKSIDNILKKSISLIEKDLNTKQIYLINKLKKLNINTTLKTNISNWVINFNINNPKELYNYLNNKNIYVYRCKDELENSTIQISITNQTINNINILCDNIKYYIQCSNLEVSL